MALNLAACGSQVTPSGKNDLKFAIDQEPASLDPYMHTKQQGFTVGTLIFETLIKKDKKGEFIPWLAKEWEFIDDTTLIFKLRDDVTFHDGSKFTAEDAVYSLVLGATSSFSKTVFASIDTENTRVLDEYTFELKLLNPYAPSWKPWLLSAGYALQGCPRKHGRSRVRQGSCRNGSHEVCQMGFRRPDRLRSL